MAEYADLAFAKNEMTRAVEAGDISTAHNWVIEYDRLYEELYGKKPQRS